MRALLAAKSEVNWHLRRARRSVGHSPLQLAAETDNALIAADLIKHGADVDDGGQPLAIAAVWAF